ncbi:MAG: hypothetical protein WBR13_13050 [Allosphingosinicella sp.]
MAILKFQELAASDDGRREPCHFAAARERPEGMGGDFGPGGRSLGADRVVAEGSQGGERVESVLPPTASALCPG